MATVGVIGAGVSGLAIAIRLERAGVDYTVFEKGPEVGGTWRDNHYPGLTIDVPSPVYTFSTDRNPGWGRWMPSGPEILEYHRQVSIRSGVRPKIRFDCAVIAATWTGSEWHVETIDGAHHRFDVVVSASGFLHHPRWPDIDGLDTFAGTTVHSAAWDDAIATTGKRIGIIGTGSTGVQLVSALAGDASHLTHFQRTPQWILPSVNFDIPALARRALARFPASMTRAAHGIEWAGDVLLGGAATKPGLRRRAFELASRAHLRRIKDPELRAKLTPDETVLCKRPVISWRFYGAVQRPDVAVVTTAIDRVEPGGVRTADGVLHELDLLILATGFHAHNYMRPIAITGVDGLTLDTAWAGGPHGYRTVALTGFPNLFMIMGPHSPLVSISIHGSAELQSDYVMQMLDVIDRDDVVSVQPSAEATRRWLQFISEGMPETVWASGCNSWYVGSGDIPVLWPYDARTWRATLAAPDLDDYELQRVAVPLAAGPVAG